jgi:hypothetical protein
MAGLSDVIGLLYRADWTRLSLSAELRFETDREPLPRPSRERWYRAWPGQRQDNGRYVGAERRVTMKDSRPITAAMTAVNPKIADRLMPPSRSGPTPNAAIP